MRPWRTGATDFTQSACVGQWTAGHYAGGAVHGGRLSIQRERRAESLHHGAMGHGGDEGFGGRPAGAAAR